jgi:REP element-mobilizing transposase RayT
MKYEKFRNTYRIQSARASWHGYDGGIYFVTICTQNREHYFGEIVYNEQHEAQMNLSDIGIYTDSQIKKINTYYPYAEIPLWIIMPNHIHAIVIIDNVNEYLNDGECGDGVWNGGIVDGIVDGICGDVCGDVCRDAINRVSTGGGTGGVTGDKNPMLKKCLGTIIRGVKARITKYARENGICFAWQSRFHDHIVRDQDELNCISEYIENNPARWALDTFNENRTDAIGIDTILRDAININL